MAEEFSFIGVGLSYRITGIFSMQVYRGEITCSKKGCLTSNVLIVAILLQFLLNPEKANQFTAKHVSRNTELGIKRGLLSTCMTRKIGGQCIETTGKEERKKNTTASSE